MEGLEADFDHVSERLDMTSFVVVAVAVAEAGRLVLRAEKGERRQEDQEDQTYLHKVGCG
jgi:hypothetical protein